MEVQGFLDPFGNLRTSDPQNADTDGDGLTDDYEAGYLTTNKDGISFWKVRSDPWKFVTYYPGKARELGAYVSRQILPYTPNNLGKVEIWDVLYNGAVHQTVPGLSPIFVQKPPGTVVSSSYSRRHYDDTPTCPVPGPPRPFKSLRPAPFSRNRVPLFFGRCNVATYYLTNSRRKNPNYSGSITAFLGNIASSKTGGEAKLVQRSPLRARIPYPAWRGVRMRVYDGGVQPERCGEEREKNHFRRCDRDTDVMGSGP